MSLESVIQSNLDRVNVIAEFGAVAIAFHIGSAIAGVYPVLHRCCRNERENNRGERMGGEGWLVDLVQSKDRFVRLRRRWNRRDAASCLASPRSRA